MAEVYGRLTGRAGVCSATLGPGAINLLLGVADATTNSTPVVALSAQVGMNRSYKESHQGVDLVSMFEPVTKWSALIATPGAVPEMVRKAFKLAQTERPGAVYLAVPEDVEEADAPRGSAPLRVNVPRPDDPAQAQVERAVAILRESRTPVVLAGHGAARADASAAVAALRRTARHPGRDDVPRQGRRSRRPSARAGRGRLHASRLCELRLRPGRRHHRRRVRVAGVRSGADQSPRRQADHPHPPVPRRGRRALRRRRRPARGHRPQPGCDRRRGRRGRRAGARPRADSRTARGRTRTRPRGRPVSPCSGADRRRHARRARSRGHRARRHRRAQDVDGAAVSRRTNRTPA